MAEPLALRQERGHKRPRKQTPPEGVFTVPHFLRWARRLELDNGERWEPDQFFLAFLEEVFAGYEKCWLVVPEANGKTTNLAGFVLYHCRFRPRAFVPWAASARDQAEIGYCQAKVFVDSMPAGERPRCYDGYRRVAFKNGSRIQVFAAGAEHADGVIPTLAILDELHRHKSLALYRTWAGKLQKRGGQLAVISTAGEPGSEFEETREAIRESATELRQEGAFVRAASERVVLHEWAVREGRFEDIAAVKAANPFSRITVESLERKRADPDMPLSHWKRFTCNIAATVDQDPYIEADAWERCAGGEPVPAGAKVTVGADGSRTWDTTVVAWAGEHDDGRLDVDARVFSAVEHHPHHVLHSGGRIDLDDVESFVLDLFARFHPLEVAYDPRYLERSMELVERRLPESAVYPVEPVSKLMREALQAFYTAVSEGRLRHTGDPVLAAHLANTKVERDQVSRAIRRIGQIDPRKPIDAVPALALAVWRAGFAQPSVYEQRGIVTV